MKKFSKNAILLLFCLLINNISSIFIYTYLLAFILNISSNGIVNVAKFYLVLHISMILLSLCIAPIIKKSKNSLFLKIGVIFKCVFVISIVLLGNKIINYVWLIAICNGIGEVLFWSGANSLQPNVTTKKSLQGFISLSKILNTMLSLIIPIIMGYFIDKIGMVLIAITMFILTIIQFCVSLFIKENCIERVSKIRFKKFLLQVKSSYPQYKHVYLNQMLYGFCSNTSMLVLYFTVITFGSNISLGVFATISSILSIVVLFVYNLKKKHFSNYIYSIISSIAVIVGVVLLLVDLNRTTLIIFYMFWHLTIIVPEMITGATRLNISQHNNLKVYNIENITISEVFLDGGRVIGEILLLVMGLIGNKVFDIIVFGIMCVVISLYFVHTYFINKHYVIDDEKVIS